MKFKTFEEFDSFMKKTSEEYNEMNLFQRQNMYLMFKNKEIYLEFVRR